MATRGARPKPTGLLVLHGTLDPSRHANRRNEPVPETEIPETAPDWLAPRQKEGWDYALANAPRGILKAIDRALLVAWVVAEDRFRTAAETQAKLDVGSAAPFLAKGRDGNAVVSPYIRIMNNAALLMVKLAGELGFSPTARPRLAAASGLNGDAPDIGAGARLGRDENDRFDTFLASRPGPLPN